MTRMELHDAVTKLAYEAEESGHLAVAAVLVAITASMLANAEGRLDQQVRPFMQDLTGETIEWLKTDVKPKVQ